MSTAEDVSVAASVRPNRPQRGGLQAAIEDPILEALHLLQRQAQIQSDLRRFGGARVTEERELFLIRNRLAQFPAAVQAITLTAAELQRPLDTLSIRDLETQGGLPRPLTRPLTRDPHTHTPNPR